MFFSCVKASISSKHSSRPEPRLLEAAERRAEEVLAHLVDPDIARPAPQARCGARVERSLVQIDAVRPYSTAFTVASIFRSSLHLNTPSTGPEDFLARDPVLLGDGEHGRLDKEAIS